MSNSIDEKLAGIPKTSYNPFIFRVHERLRRQNEEAYEPDMISIGPYHIGKEKLKKMEKYKLKYLQGILERRGESSAQRYIEALREFEEEARDCYAESISMSSQDFLEMMVLDGCFIVEFLRKTKGIVGTSEDDHIFSMGWYHSTLCRDLLLFENQLPFFILKKLFGMTRIENCRDDELIYLSISCLMGCFDAEASYEINQPRNKAFNLLRLMHESWCFSFPKETNTQEEGRRESKCTELKKWLRNIKEDQYQDQYLIEFIRSASELKEYMIKFEKKERSKSCFDISFENGIMQIPTMVVTDRTESILRNLIAYEHYVFVIDGYSRRVVTDYITFADCLINSSKDVQILCNKNIIINSLCSDEVLSDMIHKIGISVYVSPEQFSYKKIFKEVNKHCSKLRNKWIADLKKKYLQGAILLLLLTLTQTIFTVLQGVCSSNKP